MLKNWNLQGLHQIVMKQESEAAGEERILAEAINKLGSYSYRSIKESNSQKKNDGKKKCHRFDLPYKPNNIKKCKGINSKCLNSSKVGHFAKVCCLQKFIEDKSSTINDEKGSENETYQLNIWKIKLSQNVPKFNIPNKYYFKKHLFINKL